MYRCTLPFHHPNPFSILLISLWNVSFKKKQRCQAYVDLVAHVDGHAFTCSILAVVLAFDAQLLRWRMYCDQYYFPLLYKIRIEYLRTTCTSILTEHCRKRFYDDCDHYCCRNACVKTVRDVGMQVRNLTLLFKLKNGEILLPRLCCRCFWIIRQHNTNSHTQHQLRVCASPSPSLPLSLPLSLPTHARAHYPKTKHPD